MSRVVQRTAIRERLFPAITRDLYAPPGGTAQSPAGRILALAAVPLAGLQLVSGIGLDSRGQIVRLLRFHCLGFEAERRGLVPRADFFWREAQRQLGRLWANE